MKSNRVPSVLSIKEKRIGSSQLRSPAIRNIKQPVLTDATLVDTKTRNDSSTEEVV